MSGYCLALSKRQALKSAAQSFRISKDSSSGGGIKKDTTVIHITQARLKKKQHAIR